MHELSLAQEVMQILVDEAARHGLRRISAVRLEIGTLRGVVPEVLQSCLGLASRGTLAEGLTVQL